MVQLTALFAVFGLGMCFSLLGAISVKLMPRLNIDTGKFGSLVSALMITAVVASVVVGMGIDAVGHKLFAVLGFIIVGASIFVIARVPSYKAVLGACLFLGIGAMCLNNVGNTLAPEVLFDGERATAALNLANVFFGLGLFLTPFIASFLFRKTTYENAVSVLAAIAFVPVIFALLATRYPDVELGFTFGDAAGLLGQPVVLIAGLTLFCYIALESSFSNWIAPYAKQIISTEFKSLSESVVDANSQQMLSIFAITMMVGRLLASQIAIVENYGAWVIALMALIACVIIYAMTVSGAIWSGLLIGAGGLSFSVIFPTIVGVTHSKHPDQFGSVFGVIFAIGLLGAVIVPKAIGNLARGRSIQRSLQLLIPIGAILVILAIILGYLPAAA